MDGVASRESKSVFTPSRIVARAYDYGRELVWRFRRLLRMLLEMVIIIVLLAGWATLTGTSLTLDATPIPGDGTFFGEAGGIVVSILVWRLNALRYMIFVGDEP